MKGCKLDCLKLQHISVKAGDSVLIRDVNLHAHSGELTAIIGRNGAGKSTLLKAIVGQVKYTGKVIYSDFEGSVVKRPLIGYVPQYLNVERGSPTTVFDMIASLTTRYPLFLQRSHKTVKKLTEHLAEFNASHLLNKNLGRLSGGELQRVLVAAAMLPRPDILIMDEPVSGADKAGLTLFYDIIGRLKASSDLIMILVSHDLDFVKENADHVLLLDCGVEIVGSPDQVFDSKAFSHAFSNMHGAGERI